MIIEDILARSKKAGFGVKLVVGVNGLIHASAWKPGGRMVAIQTRGNPREALDRVTDLEKIK
jgi:hypothetical protein